MKKLCLSITIALFALSHLAATHIVGGEFIVEHVSPYVYKITLIQYIDALHGDPQAIDPGVSIAFYRKSDNMELDSAFLPLVNSTMIPNETGKCIVDEIKTQKLVYEQTFTFSPDRFIDPQGYYIVHARCCRNEVITNIESPGQTGQTFYIEIPPFAKDGVPYVNSTPILPEPYNKFPCVGIPIDWDLRATDIDGDSLSYVLVAPYNTRSSDPTPEPGARPYPLVIWKSGVDSLQMIPGNPALSINGQGLLTLTATAPGLYVFALACREYRFGQKIGEMRREYQILVSKGDCTNTAPQISLESTIASSFSVKPDSLFQLDITATDPDNDYVSLWLEKSNTTSFTFRAPDGLGKTSSRLSRQFSCKDLGDDGAPAIYNLTFIAEDSKCAALVKRDTVEIQITVEDVEAPRDFYIPNVFTPNGDGTNEEYKIPDIPQDNCKASFTMIKIFNRWGKLVFESSNRNFKWNGANASNGVYYYYLKFSNREYKGTLSLVY